jgi:hypothetical protein
VYNAGKEEKKSVKELKKLIILVKRTKNESFIGKAGFKQLSAYSYVVTKCEHASAITESTQGSGP